MDIGTGVATAGGAIAIAAVLMKWISVSYSDNTNQCVAHAFMTKQIEEIKLWLRRVEEKLDRVIERPER